MLSVGRQRTLTPGAQQVQERGPIAGSNAPETSKKSRTAGRHWRDLMDVHKLTTEHRRKQYTLYPRVVRHAEFSVTMEIYAQASS